MNSFDSQPNTKKLQLQVVRTAGNGPGRPTAVGLDHADDDNEPDYPVTEVPAWFKVLLPIIRPYVKKVVHKLPVDQRALLLRKSKLSRCNRKLLLLIWTVESRPELNRQDAKELLIAASESGKRLPSYKRRLERYAVWQIWRYLNT
jgi:hypothetical protein